MSERAHKKILVYFFIELSIGLFGLASPNVLDFIGRHTAGSSYAIASFYMFIFLSIPTFLMGMTLPLLTKIFNNLIRDFVKSVSFLYFINTIGAAIGTLISTYLIISFFGLLAAIYVAAAINFSLAAIIILALRLTYKNRGYAALDSSLPTDEAEHTSQFGKLAYLLVFVTGFIAIGYEIIWFRVIGVLAKDSAYAFSSVLAVYLTGIALGSLAMNDYLKRHARLDQRNLFFSIQFLLGLSVSVIFLGYFYLTKYTDFGIFTRMSFFFDLHPYPLWSFWATDSSPAYPFMSSSSNQEILRNLLLPLYRILDVFLWSALFVLIPTILMGASFPLISLLALTRQNQEGKTLGTVYFFNIAGNALGGAVTGLVLLPLLGTEPTLELFGSVGILFGLSIRGFGGNHIPLLTRSCIGAVLLLGMALFFPHKNELYEMMHLAPGAGYSAYLEEGIDGVVVTYQKDNMVKNYINGSSHGGRPLTMFQYEMIEGMSRAPRLDKVLVIGYGTGSFVETLLRNDKLGELVLVELNKTLIANLRKMPLFDTMLNDPRVRLIVDDGRRYLLRSDDKFDLITTDALRTTTAYSNNLYSEDFFRLVRDHLNSNGLFLTWQDEHRVIPKTLAAVFDHVLMYKFFCISSINALEVVDHSIRQQIADSLSPTEREQLSAHEGSYLGDRSYVEAIAGGYPINTDWEPWTEYFIGLRIKDRIQRRLMRDGLPAR